MEVKSVNDSEEAVLLLLEQEEEEEALSFCDLPNEEENQKKIEVSGSNNEVQEEDFDFCSCGGGTMLKESEMCTADEVFFQGQIMPLRHSNSNSATSLTSDSRNTSSRCISRSESMEHSSCRDTNSSSRSSSIRSQRSSSSTSTGSSSTTTTNNTCSKYKPRIRNQFHSHPSPTPQVRLSKVISHGNVNNTDRKSTLWSLFRVGLVTTPEIALQDLKIRSNKDFGSRNSTSSSSSSNENRSRMLIKKKKQRLFEGKGKFLGSCKCSANAVETVPNSSKVVIMNRRSTGNGKNTKEQTRDQEDDEDKKELPEKTNPTKQQQQQEAVVGKQAMSRHRTFEWLKQLSLEGSADEK